MNAELTITPSVDPQTGTRRLNLWQYGAESTGSYGDMARGTAYEARYLSDRDGDGYCAEIAVYPIECDDGSFGVEEMATIGKAISEDGSWRPDDSADINYEWATALAFETLEDAQAACDRLGKVDYSYALHLRGDGS